MRGPPQVLLLVLPAIWLGCHDAPHPIEAPAPGPGTIEISVAARGLLSDTTTYEVRVLDGSPNTPPGQRISYAGGDAVFADLPAGQYDVILNLPATCWTIGGGTIRRVSLAADSAARVSFTTSCFGPPDQVYAHEASDDGALATRYVLEPAGVVRLQTQNAGWSEFVGTYVYDGSTYRFEFDPSGVWTATGTAVGSCLSIDVNVAMGIDGFDSGMYCGTSPPNADFAASMPDARVAIAAAALNGVVYVAGGWNDSEARTPTSVLAYDPTQDAWRVAGQLLRPVTGAAMAAIGDRLYLVGGFYGFPLDSTTGLQVIDPANGSTTFGPPPPTQRDGPAAVVLDGRLHVLGGNVPVYDQGEFPDWRPTRAHDVFDPSTGTWSTRAPMPFGSFGGRAATLDGKIYVSGSDALQVYDPATDSWATRPSPYGRNASATIAANGKLYVIGGIEALIEPIVGAPVLRFDPVAGSWRSLTPLAAPHGWHAVARVDGTIFVLGGFTMTTAGVKIVPWVERIRVP